MNTIQVITIDQQGEIQKCQIICYLRKPEYTGKPSPSPHRGRILHRCVRCTTQQYPVDIGNRKKSQYLTPQCCFYFSLKTQDSPLIGQSYFSRRDSWFDKMLLDINIVQIEVKDQRRVFYNKNPVNLCYAFLVPHLNCDDVYQCFV